MPIIALKGFFCPRHASVRLVAIQSLPRLRFAPETLCGSTEEQGGFALGWSREGDIFDSELLVNFPCTSQGRREKKGEVRKFSLSSFHTYSSPSKPVELIYSSKSWAACRTWMHRLQPSQKCCTCWAQLLQLVSLLLLTWLNNRPEQFAGVVAVGGGHVVDTVHKHTHAHTLQENVPHCTQARELVLGIVMQPTLPGEIHE